MKIISALLLFIVCVSNIGAQQFRYEAKVDAVDSNSFYKIWLAPEINSKLKDDYVDLRLFDNDGKETPYILASEEATRSNLNFVKYEITERKSFADSITLITIRNKEKSRIDNISLQIKNAEVLKQIKFSGSDDLKNWFVVKDYATINSINSLKDVAELKLIDFPLSNYEYYRIEIDDRNSKPINILSAGYYENTTESGAYIELLPSMILNSDSQKTKTSWVQVTFNSEFSFDEMIASIASPKYFLRSTDVFAVTKDKNGKEERRFLETIELKSGQENKITFSDLRVLKLLLCVHNDDNPPLNFSDIKFYQLNRYALAYLEKSKSYSLRFGNDSISSPSYDLKYFQNIIPGDVRIIKAQAVTVLPQQKPNPIEKPYTFFTDKKFIWAAVALIILLLGAVTFGMLKEK